MEPNIFEREEKQDGPLLGVEVEGIKGLALMDTGASTSIIGSKFFLRILSRDILWKRINAQITVADGNVIDARDTILTTLKIQLEGHEPLEHELLVVDFPSHELILGWDFMKRYQAIIDVGKKTFQLRGDDTSGNANEELLEVVHDGLDEDSAYTGEVQRLSRTMPDCTTKNHKKKATVRVAEDVMISKEKEAIIPAILEGCSEGARESLMIEGNGKLPERQEVQVARVLVQEKDKVPVRVMNLSRSDQLLHKDTVLGTYEEVKPLESKSLPGQDLPEEIKSDSLFDQLVQETLEDIDPSLREQVLSLLNQLRDDFIKNANDIGHTTILPHTVDTGDSAPIRQGPRRLPLTKKQAAEEEVQRMLDMGVIRPSTSPWSSPIVLVQREDGKLRFCIDYRKLNAVTKKDSFPLPRIDDSLNALEGSCWFSTLDLASGYWQVAMHPDDIEKTAFITEGGLYEFTVLPFGMCNAGATFQRLMQLALNGLSWETILIYIDDLIVHSRSFNEHLIHLRQVFAKLRDAGLKLSPRKCRLFRKEVTFLGHVVNEKGVSTDPKKTEAVASWPVPSKVKEVQSFIGLCGYYRKFVRGFAEIAKPLYKLLERDATFNWSEECQAAFEKLKTALISAPVLSYPRQDGKFILDTDASNEAIGAVLSQEQEGEERVILYYSRTLSRPERNYCVTRRELLAVIQGIHHCHHYLLGNKFLVRSDHGSLRWLLNFKSPENQTARWLEFLSGYDFEIQHRPGVKHGNADGLSRRPCLPNCRHCNNEEAKELSHRARSLSVAVMAASTEENEEEILPLKQNCDLQKEQEQDSDLSTVRAWLEKGARPGPKQTKGHGKEVKLLWKQWPHLGVLKGLLFWLANPEDKTSNPLIVAPKTIRREIFQYLHDANLGGHQGIKRTVASIKLRFWWPSLQSDIDRWCAECMTCQRRKKLLQPKHPLKQDIADYPLERLGIDILSFTLESEAGNTCAVVVTDYYTKFSWAIPLPNHQAHTVAEALLIHVMLPFGLPECIHTDQGKEFTSDLMNDLCSLLQISRTRTTPYRPQSDGQCERQNKTLLDMVSKLCDGNTETWDQHLPFTAAAYNATPHSSTGCTPNLLMWARETTMPVDLMFGIDPATPKADCPIAYVEEVKDKITKNFEFARGNEQPCAKKAIMTAQQKSPN